MIGEIRYGKATLPEICLHISKHLPMPYSRTMEKIHERMSVNKGEIFSEVFREEMGECLKSTPLTGEDKDLFLSLFAEHGFQDETMQIRMIEQNRELLGQSVECLEREKREKCRMAVGLGAMSGLLLLIVLM